MKYKITDQTISIKSWCEPIEPEAMSQAVNLANHPAVFHHVALMPDAHVGYGMPIGGVIACENAVIPNAVGVDIGCGMCAVETSLTIDQLSDKRTVREILDRVKELVPVGEGHAHKTKQKWQGFADYLAQIGIEEHEMLERKGELPGWLTESGWNLDKKNLGTLGGGNHFIELQKSEDGTIWLMLHSGSRNMGHRIATHYHKVALKRNEIEGVSLPDTHLAFLSADSEEGKGYIRDMNFALAYALESRARMMNAFKTVLKETFSNVEFKQEINIHHNYAGLENHFGKEVWVHRKGATSARKNEMGIIPGSMGTPSYIVEGLGNPESFESCSHGAGRVMGRMAASRNLTMEACDKAMEGIVFDRWSKVKGRKRKKGMTYDFGESPLAYKNIEDVIEAELDLIKPVVKLWPVGVVKG